jgi:transposase InsO family protein
MDLYDRKIIGWSISSKLSTTKTTIPAWDMAVRNRKNVEGLIFNSDRGVQYASKAFAEKLDSYNCIRSMSRKGDHLDNAVAEGFFSTLKRELIRGENRVMTPKQMKNQIFEFIDNWYNKKRIHTSLKFKTIEEFNTLNS